MWTYNDGLCIYSPDGCNLGFSLVDFAVGQIEISLEDFARPLETPECADSRFPLSDDLALKGAAFGYSLPSLGIIAAAELEIGGTDVSPFTLALAVAADLGSPIDYYNPVLPTKYYRLLAHTSESRIESAEVTI
jgi:hypothetical protein